MCKRKGLGKVHHLAISDLWIQERVRSREIELLKVLGIDNPADVLTKYVERSTMEKAMQKLNMIPLDGRPACAPAAMGISTIRHSVPVFQGGVQNRGPLRRHV